MANVLRIQFQALLWLALLCPITVHAGQTLVLLSDSGSSYTGMSNALTQYLPNTPKTQTLQQLASAPLDDRVIAVGSRACQYALEHVTDDTHLLCTFLPAQAFVSLTQTRAVARSMLRAGRLSAVYLDQPLARQIRLARLLKPDARTIGTVVGASSEEQAKSFATNVRALKLEPVIARLHDTDNPVRVLTPIIEKSDIFLPLPDRSIFNQAAAKWILYITLRDGVPLIGFSRKYADAGACVAIYSTIDQIARQSAEMFTQYSSTSTLPPPAYPRYFSVTVNPVALRNLNLPPLQSDELIQRLQREETR